MRSAAILLCLIIFLHSATGAAAQKPRPLAGIGVILLQPQVSGRGETAPPLSLYREPGVGRLTDIDLQDLPQLSSAIQPPAGRYPLAVTKKRGDWVRIVYDDSGREGWLETVRGWEFKPWDRYLPGTDARMLHGLKKGLYLLKQAPSTSSATLATLNRDRRLRIIYIDGSWMQVLVDLETSGWLRWKDDDGRFLISLEKRL